MSGNPLSRTDPTGESWAPARGAWWVGTRIGGAINYGINAATGLSLGVIIYNVCHSESPEEEKQKKCLEKYERELDYCNLFYKANGARWFAQCKKEAFGNYQRCRGFSSPD